MYFGEKKTCLNITCEKDCQWLRERNGREMGKAGGGRGKKSGIVGEDGKIRQEWIKEGEAEFYMITLREERTSTAYFRANIVEFGWPMQHS